MRSKLVVSQRCCLQRPLLPGLDAQCSAVQQASHLLKVLMAQSRNSLQKTERSSSHECPLRASMGSHYVGTTSTQRSLHYFPKGIINGCHCLAQTFLKKHQPYSFPTASLVYGNTSPDVHCLKIGHNLTSSGLHLVGSLCAAPEPEFSSPREVSTWGSASRSRLLPIAHASCTA